MHLEMPTYQTPSKLFGKLKQHIDKVAEFTRYELKGYELISSEIAQKSLIIGVPHLNSSIHIKVFTKAKEYAKSKNVNLSLALIQKSVKK